MKKILFILLLFVILTGSVFSEPDSKEDLVWLNFSNYTDMIGIAMSAAEFAYDWTYLERNAEISDYTLFYKQVDLAASAVWAGSNLVGSLILEDTSVSKRIQQFGLAGASGLFRFASDKAGDDFFNLFAHIRTTLPVSINLGVSVYGTDFRNQTDIDLMDRILLASNLFGISQSAYLFSKMHYHAVIGSTAVDNATSTSVMKYGAAPLWLISNGLSYFEPDGTMVMRRIQQAGLSLVVGAGIFSCFQTDDSVVQNEIIWDAIAPASLNLIISILSTDVFN